MAEAGKKTEIDLLAIDPSRDRMAAEGELSVKTSSGWFRRLAFVFYILAGMLILSGGLMAAMFMGWITISSPVIQKPGQPGGVAGTKPAAAKPPEKPRDIGPTVKLSSLVINLNEGPGSHFIKTAMVLEVTQEKYLEEIKSRTAPLTDIAILTLGDQRLSDLANPEYKEKLKNELLLRMNRRLRAQKIKQIYFDEFLYQ